MIFYKHSFPATYFLTLMLPVNLWLSAVHPFKVAESKSWQHSKIPETGLPVPVIPFKVHDRYQALPLENIQMGSYLNDRMQQNLRERLLKIDENKILAGYLHRPGEQEWIGEHAGKYLETACNVWRYSHNQALKMQMDRIARVLINAQLSSGYLGTYTPDMYWKSWDVWSHKYDLYGLLAYYRTTGYSPALIACRRIGDLLYRTFGALPGQLDIMKSGEHVGMASASVLDPMLDLYRFTGDKRYLDFCMYILKSYDEPVASHLMSAIMTTGKVDRVGNAKAYEMLSNFVGIAKLYRLSGNPEYLKACRLAWHDVVKNKLYLSGTASSFEHFQPDHLLPAEEKDHMGEGCVTTTWIMFNQQLFEATAELSFYDEIEKAIYNQLLAAENPVTGCVSYYTPLMGKKPYSCDVTCCTSSVPRGIALIPYFAVGRVEDQPIILNYESSRFNFTSTSESVKHKIRFSINSKLPRLGESVITVEEIKSPGLNFTMLLRVPPWAGNFKAITKEKLYEARPEDSVIRVSRAWIKGDSVKISFTIKVQTFPGGTSYPGFTAYKRGPQVLAMDPSLNIHAKGTEVYKVQVAAGQTSDSLLLVPFAEASQRGGISHVWIKDKKVE